MKRRRGLIVWAVIAAIVLVAALIALLVLSSGRGGDPGHTATTPAPSAVPSPSSTSSDERAVDPSVFARGWVPEPITPDPDAYARAALEAAGTFDTRLATRAEWVAWLETWFTPSPLYDNEQDALDQMAGYKAELDQTVVLPQALWDDLASDDGRVTAHVDGDIEYLDLPETTHKQMWTATADVVMTYTRAADASSGEVSYDQTVRVSVQVVCSGASVPAPGSAQQPGDCKVVRFFDAAVG